jgi:hypothetical protein
MKKRVKKLVLAKETVRELTEGQTKGVWGGMTAESCAGSWDLNYGPGDICLALETLG